MGNTLIQGPILYFDPDNHMTFLSEPQNIGYQRRRNPMPQHSQTDLKEQKHPELVEAENNPNSGHYYKRLGNESYAKGLYEEALKHYTMAIELTDTESIFFSNRGRCFKKLGDFKKAYEDAKQAIEVEDKNVKAHVLCGEVLAEMSKLEPGFEKINLAIVRLTKALTLCAGQNRKDYEKEIHRNILKARKIKWYKEQEMSKMHKMELLICFKELLDKNFPLNTEENTKKYQAALQFVGDPTDSPKFDVPDYLCCKITMELMENPVITPAGITYEEEALFEHFNKNGPIDPVSRIKIDIGYVVPNLSVKNATDLFLKENPWAYDYMTGETIKDIIF